MKLADEVVKLDEVRITEELVRFGRVRVARRPGVRRVASVSILAACRTSAYPFLEALGGILRGRVDEVGDVVVAHQPPSLTVFRLSVLASHTPFDVGDLLLLIGSECTPSTFRTTSPLATSITDAVLS